METCYPPASRHWRNVRSNDIKHDNFYSLTAYGISWVLEYSFKTLSTVRAAAVKSFVGAALRAELGMATLTSTAVWWMSIFRCCCCTGKRYQSGRTAAVCDRHNPPRAGSKRRMNERVQFLFVRCFYATIQRTRGKRAYRNAETITRRHLYATKCTFRDAFTPFVSAKPYSL